MVQAVDPFLMFQGEAEAAIDFYMSVLPGSSVVDIKRYGPDGPGRPGSVLHGRCVLSGTSVQFADSPIQHSFGFTPSLSLFVTCDSNEEIDRIAEALGQDGKLLMPLGAYGFSRRFAWLNDKFGVSWQLNLP